MTEEAYDTYKIKKKSLILNLFLSLITFNVFTFIWLYRVLKDSDRIAAKKKDSMHIYYVLILFYVLLVTFCIMWNTILIFLAVCYDTNIGFPLVEISSLVMESVAISALMVALLIPVSLFAIGTCVCFIIIAVRIAKNLGAPVGYYVVFVLFPGIIAINLIAQDEINAYAGTYHDDERPKYLNGHQHTIALKN